MHVYVMRLCSSFAADDGEMESVSSASVPQELSRPQLGGLVMPPNYFSTNTSKKVCEGWGNR